MVRDQIQTGFFAETQFSAGNIVHREASCQRTHLLRSLCPVSRAVSVVPCRDHVPDARVPFVVHAARRNVPSAPTRNEKGTQGNETKPKRCVPICSFS